MPLLDLIQIKRDATDRIEFANAMENLQAVVDRLYPGHTVAVLSPDEQTQVEAGAPADNAETEFSEMTGVQQMVAVLKEQPRTARELFEEMRSRGATIPKTTVQSTLSRKKDTFRNGDGGIWSVVLSANGTNGAH